MTDRYALRRERLAALAKKSGLDVFLVTDEVNVSYLTGFSGDDSYLLLNQDRWRIVSDTRYEQQLREESPGLEAVIRKPGQGMISAIAGLFSRNRGISLGVEAGSMTIRLVEKITETIPKAEIQPIVGAVEALREIKDRSEIEAIRLAVRAAARGFDIVRRSLRPSLSEIDIRNDLEYQMRKMGADDRAFPTIVAARERAALPHAVPSERTLDGADHLLIDWGAKANFYVSDLTRVLIIDSHPSAKLAKIYETVLKAQKTAIAAIKPGAVASQIDAIARKVIEDAGFGRAFGHGLGHGIGRVVHDRGGLSMGNQAILRPGMVLTVEPGIYLPGWGGVRIEDDILVTRNGYENLSDRLPKEFDEMFVEL